MCVCLEAKEDSSSVVSSPDTLAVYLHLPYTGHTCFLFQQEEKQDHFLSALKTCIRHCNLGKTETLHVHLSVALTLLWALCWTRPTTQEVILQLPLSYEKLHIMYLLISFAFTVSLVYN